MKCERAGFTSSAEITVPRRAVCRMMFALLHELATLFLHGMVPEGRRVARLSYRDKHAVQGRQPRVENTSVLRVSPVHTPACHIYLSCGQRRRIIYKVGFATFICQHAYSVKYTVLRQVTTFDTEYSGRQNNRVVPS